MYGVTYDIFVIKILEILKKKKKNQQQQHGILSLKDLFFKGSHQNFKGILLPKDLPTWEIDDSNP